MINGDKVWVKLSDIEEVNFWVEGIVVDFAPKRIKCEIQSKCIRPIIRSYAPENVQLRLEL